MAVRLGSVFRSPSWSLKFKTVTYAFALWWLWRVGTAGPAPLFFFIGAASFFYFSSFFQGIRFFASFAVLIALSLVAAYTAVSFYSFAIAALSASFLFYVLLAMKEYFFVHRQWWYAVLNFILAAWAGAFIFSSSVSALFLGIVYFFLLLEYLLFNAPSKRVLLFGLVISLILYQIIWAIALLPVGFISQTALASLFYYAARELTFAHVSGRLSRTYALRWLTVIIFVSTAVLLGSQWSL